MKFKKLKKFKFVFISCFFWNEIIQEGRFSEIKTHTQTRGTHYHMSKKAKKEIKEV